MGMGSERNARRLRLPVLHAGQRIVRQQLARSAIVTARSLPERFGADGVGDSCPAGETGLAAYTDAHHAAGVREIVE